MANIKAGPIRPQVDLFVELVRHPVSGQCPTDGIQYSAAATFGTTAVDVFNQLIAPGVNLSLHELEVGFTQKFTEVASVNGSLTYQWSARSEYVNAFGSLQTTAYANITAAQTKGIAALANSEDTFSGYVNVGSVPAAPFRIRLQATALAASAMTCVLKNSSYVRFAGIVIPGT